MNMKRSKGYSLIELALVLVVISLSISIFIGGYSMYRERAAYFGETRNAELDELITMNNNIGTEGHPVVVVDPDGPMSIVPAEEPTTDPVVEGEPDVRSWWVIRWENWRRRLDRWWS